MRSNPKPNARLRLFCFPYAGGGASLFATWGRMLTADIEICAIQLPGRENRLNESPLVEWTELLDHLERAIKPFLDKPFAFFGHSNGAMISFELARRLQAQYPPSYLFAAGCPAPQLPNLTSPLHTLSDVDFIAGLQQRYQNIPQAVLQEKEVMALFLGVLRADLTLFETYHYIDRTPFNCPLSVFGGLQDKTTGREKLTAWSKQTSITFTQRMLPGDHFFLKSAQQPLLNFIAQDLELLSMENTAC